MPERIVTSALAFLAAVVLLIGGPPAYGANELRAAEQDAVALYASGKILSAIKGLRAALGSSTGSAQERRTVYTTLLDMCIAAEDVVCLDEEVMNFVRALPDSGKHRGEPSRNLYYLGAASLYNNNRVDFKKNIVDGGSLTRKLDAAYDPLLYIRSQLLVARHFLFDQDFSGTRNAIDRALAHIVALERPSTFFVAQWLVQCIQILGATGDTVRADALFSVSREFLNAVLPPGSLEFAQFKLLESQIAAYYVDATPAIQALNVAADKFEKLELPQYIRDYYFGEALLRLSVECVWANDFQCAHQALERHPFSNKADELIENGSFRGPLELTYAAARAMVSALTNRAIPSSWEDALELEVKGFGDLHTDTLNAYRAYVRGLLYISRDQDRARAQFLLAGRERLKGLRRLLEGADDSFPMPSILDRILLGTAIVALGRETAVEDEDIAMAPALFELFNRNLRYADSDALAALASAPSVDVRRQIHSRMRLYARQQTSERELLLKLLERFNSSSTKTSWALNHRVRSHLARYGKVRARISALTASETESRLTRTTFPTLQELQSALQPAEALVSVVGAVGHLAVLCVRKDFAIVKATPVSPEAIQHLINDTRVLHLSLTALHPPSDVLDSQYPVREALRLYSSLFGPIEECMRDGDHVVWIPPGDLLTVPVAALIRSAPPTTGESHDLRRASWLIDAFAISRASSIRGFLAARAIGSTRDPQWSFLGIGDPILSGFVQDGRPRDEVVLGTVVKSRATPLRQLQELPETSQELRAIERVLGADARSLLREKATEADLRRQFLDRYAVIDFATHGLVREEVPGLTEAALVLTPIAPDDHANDGLLTASEIANLNLNAKLIVLSACNSANIDLALFGNEVQGLASAFAIAGAPTVLATLWPVETETSRNLMVRMFEHLKEASPARALQKATKNFLREVPAKPYAHPRFWAPFLLHGDGNLAIDVVRRPIIEVQAHNVDLSRARGEAGSIAVDSAGEGFYVTGYADPVNGRFQSFVRYQAKTGNEIWTYRDPLVGSSAGVALTKDGLITGGYLSEGGNRTVPIVRSIDKRGKLMWQRKVDIGASDGIAMSTVGDGRGNAIVVTSVMSGGGDERKVGALVSLVAADGTELRRREISFGHDVWVPPSRAFVAADKVYVVLATSPYTETDKPLRDDYGLWYSCAVRRRLMLAQLDPATLEVMSKRAYRNVEINDLVDGGAQGPIVAATLHAECGESETTAALMRLTADGELKPIYVLRSPFSTWSAALSKTAEGDLYYSAKAARRIDSESPTWTEEQQTDLDYLRAEAERRVAMESVILKISPDGQVKQKAWLQNGGNLAVNDVLWISGTLHVVGVSGREAMHAVLQ